MAKTIYRFNEEKLLYEPIKSTFKSEFFRVLSIIFSGLFFAAIVLVISFNFFKSPKQILQQRELDQYKLQFSILNDRLDRLDNVADNLQERDDNIYRVIFEAEPVPDEIREAGIGGSDRYSELKGFKNSEQLLYTSKKVDELSNKLYVQSTSFDEVFEMARNKEAMMASIPAIQPISDKYKRRISNFYGYRIHPIYKTKIFHQGVDFSAPIGTEVYAAGDGIVSETSHSRYGYGNIIKIDHGYGYMSYYAHLDKITVSRRQKIKRGQIIGFVGNTGLSTGPHLHYEVHKNEKRVNPIYYFFNDLNVEDYDEIIKLASYSVANVSN
ncbi:MAG: M23 family metallopeptidase [Bacteroidales bacterium]|jgi:murein DD-endopeptidase MepM/ murein hydrolase activator NlpD|nr:M23 family metallopeptidase [Bacteroidales bacterium]